MLFRSEHVAAGVEPVVAAALGLDAAADTVVGLEHEQAVRPMMPPLDEPTMDDEVGLLLSDARERAQAIIDESITRAQELLRAQPSSQALERIRRTVADLSVDVRAIHSRLDEIEALMR